MGLLFQNQPALVHTSNKLYSAVFPWLVVLLAIVKANRINFLMKYVIVPYIVNSPWPVSVMEPPHEKTNNLHM